MESTVQTYFNKMSKSDKQKYKKQVVEYITTKYNNKYSNGTNYELNHYFMRNVKDGINFYSKSDELSKILKMDKKFNEFVFNKKDLWEKEEDDIIEEILEKDDVKKFEGLSKEEYLKHIDECISNYGDYKYKLIFHKSVFGLPSFCDIFITDVNLYKLFVEYPKFQKLVKHIKVSNDVKDWIKKNPNWY